MSQRRKPGEWVRLCKHAGFVGESDRLLVQIQAEEVDDPKSPVGHRPDPTAEPDPCMGLCDDEGCREWATVWTEPDPQHGGRRHALCHVSECQMSTPTTEEIAAAEEAVRKRKQEEREEDVAFAKHYVDMIYKFSHIVSDSEYILWRDGHVARVEQADDGRWVARWLSMADEHHRVIGAYRTVERALVAVDKAFREETDVRVQQRKLRAILEQQYDSLKQSVLRLIDGERLDGEHERLRTVGEKRLADLESLERTTV